MDRPKWSNLYCSTFRIRQRAVDYHRLWPQWNTPERLRPTSVQVCRDNNAGNFLQAYTLYYYQVQACPASGSCTAFSTNQNYTYASDCLPSQIPSQEQQGRMPPSPTPVMLATKAVTPNASYALNNKEIVAFANPAPALTPVPIPYQNKLLVWLPGSDEFADFEPLMYTAVNLGFDAISVNYESYYDQEAICQGSNFSGSGAGAEAAACFGNITQAKLNLTGPCIATANPFPTTTLCGTVPAGGNGPSPSGGPYYLTNIWDAVIPRITTMLQYLCKTPEYEITPGYWEAYLSPSSCSNPNVVPNWSKIILAGHSQGGDMATFAAYENKVSRVINLSAPPQATVVNKVMTPASYFAESNTSGIQSIFGLVSANDTAHYVAPSGTVSVYEAVWQAMGYSYTYEDDYDVVLFYLDAPHPVHDGLICNPNDEQLANNFAIDTPASPGGGHNDPRYIWNEDIYVYMLLDNYQ